MVLGKTFFSFEVGSQVRASERASVNEDKPLEDLKIQEEQSVALVLQRHNVLVHLTQPE